MERVMKRCKLQSVNGCRILKLPLDLLNNILSRLTVVSIFSCKCVCKTFLEILSDPHFVQLHLKRLPNIHDSLILQNRENVSKLLLVYNNKFEIEYDHPDSDSHPCQMLGLPTIISTVYNLFSNIIGSCNGLLCIRYTSEELDYAYYICNPILGEFFALPKILKIQGDEISGFGFCPKTKKYKVIRFMNPETCTIYTLGSDHHWRKIGYVPYPRSMVSFDSSLNGNLHWITNCSSTSVSNLICCFNLETEQFSFICPPPQFDQDMYKRACHVRLGLLGGLLCFNYVIEDQFEAFVWKDYGLNGYWIKEFSISLCPNTLSLEFSSYMLINLLNSGDLMLNCDFYSLVCYNLRKGTTRFMLDDKPMLQGATDFVPGFISLKDIVSGANVEVVQRKMGRNLLSDKGYRFIDWHPSK